ncbi:hypothetical protein M430DRAFT_28366 [Amorphotheca resinae ATCC 22711]|uniref:CN hydrolase domain-containing protein n=1 Tax=Amorphotheca resinae ATCC 22711 TaxID=857342 RepID=A0A2T3AZL7_AMORE|nr:hypothetical protein M430DRAFT_28366 [Amorphotheca resinae ATCC 22711]PSS16598.1 hypothetical protein M430DRAFT_28366 [Amorphotheca resinae ATCC 22711]
MRHNLAQARILAEKAAEAGAKAVFLPEASDYINHSPEETISLVQERDFVTGLQKEAKTHKIAINFGIHEPGQKSPKKVRNMSIWIDEDGEIVQRYQKLHLFDINIEDGPRARAIPALTTATF